MQKQDTLCFKRYFKRKLKASIEVLLPNNVSESNHTPISSLQRTEEKLITSNETISQMWKLKHSIGQENGFLQHSNNMKGYTTQSLERRITRNSKKTLTGF